MVAPHSNRNQTKIVTHSVLQANTGFLMQKFHQYYVSKEFQMNNRMSFRLFISFILLLKLTSINYILLVVTLRKPLSWKKFTCAGYIVKPTNNMKGQDSMFPPYPTRPIEMFSKDNYLHKQQDTDFKGTIIHLTKKFKEHKENTNKISSNSKRIAIHAKVIIKKIQIPDWIKWGRQFETWKLNPVKRLECWVKLMLKWRRTWKPQ